MGCKLHVNYGVQGSITEMLVSKAALTAVSEIDSVCGDEEVAL